MKTVRTVCFVAVVLFLCACPALGVLEFKDGLTHNIDYTVNEAVWVDYQTPYMYTTVNWLTGGRIDWPSGLYGFENSRINILGGSIGSFLSSYDSSQVNISGGSIWELYSYGFSRVDIFAGSIGGGLWSGDSSQVDISGGSIANDLALLNQSQIKIFGSDFEVDNESVGYGEITSVFGGDLENEPWRRLTGELLSGELIDNDFRIGHDARIILIPEPATVLLLGLGGLFLRKRQEGR